MTTLKIEILYFIPYNVLLAFLVYVAYARPTVGPLGPYDLLHLES